MLDTKIYMSLIQSNFPQIAIRTVLPITRGWDSYVLEVNNEWIFRFPLRDDVIEYFQKEQILLPVLEPILSTPIPHFDFLGHGDTSYPYPFVGYRKLVGIPLEDENISSEQFIALIPSLATFLSELHNFPLVRAVEAGMQDQTPEQWRESYQERYADVQKRVFPLLNAEMRAKSSQLWETFLENQSIFTFQPALIHCDLVSEHILSNPKDGILTGVIDWGDATIGDPAIDFVGLYQRKGKYFTEQVIAQYSKAIDLSFWQRLDFYLCYEPYSQLLYGAYSGEEQFISRGIDGLRMLFGI